jgi:hypothetical protein
MVKCGYLFRSKVWTVWSFIFITKPLVRSWVTLRVGFFVYEVTLAQGFLGVLRFCPSNNLLPLLFIHLYPRQGNTFSHPQSVKVGSYLWPVLGMTLSEEVFLCHICLYKNSRSQTNDLALIDLLYIWAVGCGGVDQAATLVVLCNVGLTRVVLATDFLICHSLVLYDAFWIYTRDGLFIPFSFLLLFSY